MFHCRDMLSSAPDHFRPHDSLNLPTYIHISLSESKETLNTINLPFSFRLEDPTLERIAVKKLICIESGYAFPHIDIVFARGETGLIKSGACGEQDEKSCGFYKSVQTISRNSTELQLVPKTPSENCLNGYVIFAYKTMEHMHTPKFTSSWKTWSGARMLSTRMPLPHIVTKMSFFKKVSGQLTFEYILIAKVKNMMMNAAPALNVLHYMKPKVCAYVGAYRKISFEVNRTLCRSLGLIDSNYADAMTNRFRVSYSNNTGYVELSEFVEFRCKEEEEEAREMRERPFKKNIEVQTEPTESSRRSRRTLPRTLPSTPVLFGSPSSTHSFYPTYPSPNSVIGSILQHKSQIVTIGNNYLLVLDNRDTEAPKRQEKVINEQIAMITPKHEHKRFTHGQSVHELLDSSLGPSTWDIPPEDDGALLRRLKTEYFNSEEYTAAELCEHTPK